MVNNLRIKKILMELGITTVALIHGTLGCGEVIAAEEDVKKMVSMVENKNLKGVETISTSLNDTSAPEETPMPKFSSTPYDPYTLTDEEAIEIGTYIYDNYIVNYEQVEGSFFKKYAYQYTKQDIINYVCLFNEKYPALYPDRRSACSNGDLLELVTFYEVIIDVNDTVAIDKRKTDIFPYSICMKEGRPEKRLLEELEQDFYYISNNKVTDEEIYKYWGKVFGLAINYEETFKDWDNFNTLMFYYMVRGQYYYFMECPEIFNYIPCCVPAKYVFNNKNDDLDLKDAFYYVNTTTKQKYPSLTNEEYLAYIGCFDRVLSIFYENNIENDNFIKQKKKSSN